MLTDTTAARLLACLHHPARNPQPQIAADCADWSVAEWEAVVRLAAQTWLLPLLYGQLDAQQLLPLLPAHLHRTLSSAYRQNALRNLELFQVLLQLLQRFEEAHIPVLLLKGAHLANFSYADPALRTMGDVDILVAREQIAQAEKLLRTLGLQPPANEAWNIEQHYHLRFTQPGTEVIIELHWHVHQPDGSAQIDIAALWANARATTLAGVPVWILAPEDLLLHLSYHVAKHSFDYGGLRSSCDIATVLTQPQARGGENSSAQANGCESPIQWQLVIERASAWSIQKQVHLALMVADRLCHLAIPPDVLVALQPPTLVQSYIDQAQVMILNPQEKKVSWDYIQWWHASSWRVRLELIWRSWFLPRPQLAQLYGVPETKFWLSAYYLVRLKDILQRYGVISLQMMCGEKQTRQRIQKLGAFIPWLHTP